MTQYVIMEKYWNRNFAQNWKGLMEMKVSEYLKDAFW